MIITPEKKRQLDGMIEEINTIAKERVLIADDDMKYSYNNNGDESIFESETKLKRTIQYSMTLVLLAIMMILAIFGSQLIFGRYDDLFYRFFKNTYSNLDKHDYSNSTRV